MAYDPDLADALEPGQLTASTAAPLPAARSAAALPRF